MNVHWSSVAAAKLEVERLKEELKRVEEKEVANAETTQTSETVDDATLGRIRAESWQDARDCTR